MWDEYYGVVLKRKVVIFFNKATLPAWGVKCKICIPNKSSRSLIFMSPLHLREGVIVPDFLQRSNYLSKNSSLFLPEMS